LAYCEPFRETGKILAMKKWTLRKHIRSGDIQKDDDTITYNFDLGSGFANTIQRLCRS
jgi:hypothetical protein